MWFILINTFVCVKGLLWTDADLAVDRQQRSIAGTGFVRPFECICWTSYAYIGHCPSNFFLLFVTLMHTLQKVITCYMLATQLLFQGRQICESLKHLQYYSLQSVYITVAYFSYSIWGIKLVLNTTITLNTICKPHQKYM